MKIRIWRLRRKGYMTMDDIFDQVAQNLRTKGYKVDVKGIRWDISKKAKEETSS